MGKKGKSMSSKKKKSGFEKTAGVQGRDDLFDSNFSLEERDEDNDSNDSSRKSG